MADESPETHLDDLQISVEDLKNAELAATRAWAIIQEDRTGDEGLGVIRDYLAGNMRGPYMPSGANAEYQFLAKRSTSNWLIPALNAPAQALYLEDHRLSTSNGTDSSPAFASAFHRNRLRGRQSDLYRDALAYEQAYAIVMPDEREGSVTKGLARILLASRLNSVALYVDPVNDERPSFFLMVQKEPESEKIPGYGLAWDREHVYDVAITSGKKPITLSNARDHGLSDCPVHPFTPYRDLTGKPRGVIRPLIPIQDRINQTIFDLMVAQSYGAFVVRYITGMVPPSKKVSLPVTKIEMIVAGEIDENDPLFADMAPTDIVGFKTIDQLDSDGNVVPENVTISPSKLMVLEDPAAKVGALPATPLDGYISSIEMSVQHLSAIAQVPPQFLMGNISNLSADALAALAAALDRMVEEFKHSFGESWDGVFRDVAEVEGLPGSDDYNTEPVWRDMTSRSLSQTIDALGKAVTMLGVPGKALWGKVPGTTASEVHSWDQLAADQAINHESTPQSSLRRNLVPARQQATTPPTPTEEAVTVG